jgi:predicted dehydrogenase
MFRIGIAGVGGLGQVHLRNYLKMDDVAVTALADLVPERRSGKIAGGEVNISELAGGGTDVGQVQSFDDYRPLCKEADVDMVCVALPTDLHADAAIAALEAGKHVLSEKPMALSAVDAQRMIDAAAAADRKLMIGQVLRFAKVYQRTLDEMQSGRHGKVLAVMMSRRGRAASGLGGWFREPARSGGAVVDLHLHDVDTALWWFGMPASIEAGGARRGESYDIIHSRWQYEGGPSVQFECYWDAGTPFTFDFRVVMENATLIYELGGGKGLQLATPEGVTTLDETPVGQAYFDEDRYFIDCVKSGRAIEQCDPRDSKRSLEVAMQTREAMARSLGVE